jgi:hypothetical protein
MMDSRRSSHERLLPYKPPRTLKYLRSQATYLAQFSVTPEVTIPEGRVSDIHVEVGFTDFHNGRGGISVFVEIKGYDGPPPQPRQRRRTIWISTAAYSREGWALVQPAIDTALADIGLSRDDVEVYDRDD